MVPITKRGLQELQDLMTLWIYFGLQDHPSLLREKSMTLASPAIEERTSGGKPVGSVCGLTVRRLSPFVRASYAIPPKVGAIADYDHRYRIAARFMFATGVSVVGVPNPSTLLRLAGELEGHSEEILRGIHEGDLGLDSEFRLSDLSGEQRAIYQTLRSRLKPDPARSRRLANLLGRRGRIQPRDVWPGLQLIGTWLGGSAGVQADQLFDPYGDVPLRDLGFRATEGIMTVPDRDGIPAGPLALGHAFFEFIEESEMEAGNSSTRLAHELEPGKRYYILLTNSSGLYRYDINDIVEVKGMRGPSPLIAFVRKGRDMASLTGEKLHALQVAEATARAREDLGLASGHVQLIADVDSMRYDLLAEVPSDRIAAFAVRLDELLSELNIEYSQKRGSGRLGPPRPVAMCPGWEARRRRFEVETLGKRDAQYKWAYLPREWDEFNESEALRERTDPGS